CGACGRTSSRTAPAISLAPRTTRPTVASGWVTARAASRSAPPALQGSRAAAVPALAAAAVVLGMAVRSRAVALTDFPLNDGGMFYAAIQDIQRAHYGLPTELSYNGGIPFVYPPLAFYVAAAVADVGGVMPTEALRFLPLAFNAIGLAAFIPVASGLLSDARSRTIALFAFALFPSGFVWLVMGGGLTRSLGFLFAVAALGSLRSFLGSPRPSTGAGTAVLSALTLVSHIEMAWFLAFSSGLLVVAHGRSAAAARGVVAIGGAALVLAAPWWAVALARHGPGPFLAAATTGALSDPVQQLLRFRETAEPYFPLLAGLSILGMAVCVARRDFLLPAWVAAAGLLDSRSFGAVATVPMALLVAHGVTGVVVPFIRDRRTVALLAAAAVTYASAGALAAEPDLLRPLTPGERDAMSWVARNTRADSRVLVVSEAFWASDRASEWLPALSGRRSVATVQGTEWLPSRAFWKQLDRFDLAQECGSQGGDCLERWAASSGTSFDLAFIPKARLGDRADGSTVWCCSALRAALRSDPRYELIYDAAGATIFARRS
ncbi:MAG: hypothetical protein ABR525_05400, partial [Candidatus Limnocylindria bacterium]